MQKRERQAVQGLRGERWKPSGLGHHRRSHDLGAGGEHRRTCQADTVEQGAADQQEDDDLGGDRKRP
jgi:hypothetical protein